ncbi:MAG: peptidylprolyl isomerase, partial [Planctomycetes bacterium]|nr:peptidylprolyl isomerase [Planctomycetota bacterium]
AEKPADRKQVEASEAATEEPQQTEAAQQLSFLTGEGEIPDKPPLWPDQIVLPAPDLTITQAEIDAMQGKAAVIHTTVGSIVIEFRPQYAPQTVKNFIYLAKKGFYEGLYFYRVVPTAYIESGSPNGRRGGTAGYWFNMEMSSLPPVIGSIAMLPPPAGKLIPKTSSEFVIFAHDAKEMEGTCSVFGRVIDRFDVAEKCADTWADKDAYATERTYITKVEIVDLKTVKPKKDFWKDYGKS